MKRVWKCDFCSHTSYDIDKMEKHENECNFNPKNKACWTCIYHESDYELMICSKKVVEYWDYEDEGNCPMWKTEDEKLLRKMKLKEIENEIKED